MRLASLPDYFSQNIFGRSIWNTDFPDYPDLQKLFLSILAYHGDPGDLRSIITFYFLQDITRPFFNEFFLWQNIDIVIIFI